MTSLRRYPTTLQLLEARQFIVPLVSLRSAGDPRAEFGHALGQLVLVHDGERGDATCLQIYTYDRSFLGALPPVVVDGRGASLLPHVLGRLAVGLGYLPSSLSSPMDLKFRQPPSPDALADVEITDGGRLGQTVHIIDMLRRLTRVAPYLDMWPAIPMMRISEAGKSYHFGGSFPHSRRCTEWWQTDEFGRLNEWRSIYLIDGSVLPSIGSTTFAATVMANAHRIGDHVSASVLAASP